MSTFFAKNFRYSEIMCPCGCGKDKPIDPKLSYLLQSLRNKIDRPIYISKGGGLRCKAYNRRIGGYLYSAHLKGMAVDCRGKNINLIDFAREARDIGFSRVGIYKSFIHIDTVRPYRNSSWVRDKVGKYHYFKTLEESILFAKEIGLWYN